MADQVSPEERAERWWNDNVIAPTTNFMTNEYWRTNVGGIIRVAEKQARAEVLGACIALVKKRRENPNVPLAVAAAYHTACTDILIDLFQHKPAAADLEELLRKEREKVVKSAPECWWYNSETREGFMGRYFAWHKKQLAELEKARASEGKR